MAVNRVIDLVDGDDELVQLDFSNADGGDDDDLGFSELTVIDNGLVHYGLARASSSYDGNCFFTSAVRASVQQRALPTTTTPATLRRNVADEFSRDLFGMAIDKLFSTKGDDLKKLTIRRQSLYYWNFAIMNKYDGKLLLKTPADMAIDAAVVAAAREYALKLATDRVFVDQYVGCQVLASVIRRRVRLLYVHGNQPELHSHVYFPMKDQVTYATEPMINMVYLWGQSHFEPAFLRLPTQAPPLTVESRPSKTSATKSSRLLIEPTLAAPFTGEHVPFTVYVHDKERRCFRVDDLARATVDFADHDLSVIRIAQFKDLYIGAGQIYSVILGTDEEEVWFLFALRMTMVNGTATGECEYAGLAVGNIRQCCVYLDETVLCLVAVNEPSLTLAEGLANKYVKKYIRFSLNT